MHIYQEHIGKKIPPSLSIEVKEKRLEHGLSQVELLNNSVGNAHGSKQYLLSRLEAGRLKKVTHDICLLCIYLNIDLRKHIESPEQCMSEVLSSQLGKIWSANPEKGLLAYQLLKSLS